MDLTRQPTTDPTTLYRGRDCLYADDLLTASLVHLDLFTWLHDRGTATEGEIRDHFTLQPRGTDVLLTLLRARDLLTEANGTFSLTPVAEEHCVKHSPFFLGPYYASLKDRAGVRDLLEVLRTGRPVLWGGKQEKKTDWHEAMLDDTFAQSFTAAMDCRGVHLGQALAKSLNLSGIHTLLDIAGGSGIYACALAAQFPHLRATVLEQPPVDAIAARMIERRGASARVNVLAGDMMTAPLPTGFDAHLWSNVLHDWDIAEVKQLLAASAATLARGAQIIIHDCFLNESKSGPLHAAEYSVTLAHATQGRCYGTGEMRAWLTETGFDQITYVETTCARGVMTACRQ
jgi:predicted O-methyltransferase YrrM